MSPFLACQLIELSVELTARWGRGQQNSDDAEPKLGPALMIQKVGNCFFHEMSDGPTAGRLRKPLPLLNDPVAWHPLREREPPSNKLSHGNRLSGDRG